MKIVEGLKYSKDHEWVKVEGNLATIGITDFAQHSLGDIVYIELPEIGDTIGKDETFGVVESVKAASDVYLPVSGTVVKINEAVIPVSYSITIVSSSSTANGLYLPKGITANNLCGIPNRYWNISRICCP